MHMVTSGIYFFRKESIRQFNGYSPLQLSSIDLYCIDIPDRFYYMAIAILAKVILSELLQSGVGDIMKVLKLNFGMTGKKVDAFGMRFYGDIDSKLGLIGSISEMVFDPDVSHMMKYKRITLWFNLEKIQPYKEISDLLDNLKIMLRKEGYSIIISSIDGLVDTTLPEYANKPESGFPPPDRMHGYNAASSFSVTAEKKDTKSKFSQEEIETIQVLAIKYGRTVYGRSLKRIM